MAKNKISDLRDHLFETLERLKDKDEPMDIERARAICGVAKTLIDSARVEVAAIKAVGEIKGQDTDVDIEFFGHAQRALPPAPPVSKPNGKARAQ